MEPILDSDDAEDIQILNAPKQWEATADYSQLILRAYRPRVVLVVFLSAVLVAILYYIVRVELWSVLSVLSVSMIFLIPFIVGFLLLFSFLYIYGQLLRETWQMRQDLKSQKVIVFESNIIEKEADNTSDTPYHVVLRHTIDKKKRFPIAPLDYQRCQVGHKVQVVLSSEAKLLLALRT